MTDLTESQINQLFKPKSLDYYANLTAGGEYQLSLNQREACVALKIHDRGIDGLDDEERQLLYALIGKLKNEIRP